MEYVTNILFLQAIDPRTRMVLFKMLNRGVFHDINGCISTGKEVCMNFNFCTDDTYCMFQFLILKKLNHSIFFPLSQQANVYHAIKADSQELAIKVYKTSILVFKYVEMNLLLVNEFILWLNSIVQRCILIFFFLDMNLTSCSEQL